MTPLSLEDALVLLIYAAKRAITRLHRINILAGEEELAGTELSARILEQAHNSSLFVAVRRAKVALAEQGDRVIAGEADDDD